MKYRRLGKTGLMVSEIGFGGDIGLGTRNNYRRAVHSELRQPVADELARQYNI